MHFILCVAAFFFSFIYIYISNFFLKTLQDILIYTSVPYHCLSALVLLCLSSTSFTFNYFETSHLVISPMMMMMMMMVINNKQMPK